MRNEFMEMEINQADAVISKLPTDRIREFKEALSAHFVKASKSGQYKKEFEEMLKKYEIYILHDEIGLKQHVEAVVKCSKELGECIL